MRFGKFIPIPSGQRAVGWAVSRNETLDVGNFDVRLADVVLPIGLSLDTVVLTGRALHVESKPFKAVSPQPGNLRVTVGEKSLAAFLEKQAPGGLRDFSVRLKDGRLYIEATKNVIIDVRAKAVCTLRIVNGREVFVDLESVDVMGAGVKNLVQTQLEKLNPVLDTRDFPVEAELDSVTADEGHLIVLGRVSPPSQ
jgi:hypothetical protein